MLRSRAACLSVAAVLALVGCTSGKESSSGAPKVTQGAVPTTVPRGIGDPFCDYLRTYNERFGKIDLGLADPLQLRTTMQEAGAAITEAQGHAPDAIRPDLVVLSQAFQQLLAILQQANYDLTKVSLAQVQQFQTPAVTTAGQNVDTYLRDHC